MVYMEPNHWRSEEVLIFMEKSEDKLDRCKKLLMLRMRRRRIEQL